MGKVRWTREARDDLHDIYGYIRRDSPTAAEALVARLFLSTRRLEGFPRSGRVIPELAEVSHREIIVGNYRVMYRLEVDTVWIVAVAHGRQQLGQR